jgi:DNA-directed RNA polymerase specialized sigma24 family protein
LKVSVGAVESLLHRAKASLKQALTPMMNTTPDADKN